MQDSPPDFTKQIDPSAFQVPGNKDLSARLTQSASDTNAINYDWSNTNAAIGNLGTNSEFWNKLASGEGLQGGNAARMGQEDLGANSGDPQSLGKALMRLGSKQSAAQTQQVVQGNEQQQMQAAQHQQALKQAAAAAKLDMYKKEQELDAQKFQMVRATKQAQTGMDLATLQMHNLFNNLTAQARNATDLGDLRVRQDNFNEVMGYISMGLGAASSVAAAGAASMATGNAQQMAQNQSDAQVAGAYDAQSGDMTRQSMSNMRGNIQDLNSASYSTPVTSSATLDASIGLYGTA